MHRELGQPSLVEAWLPGKLGQNRRLERIAELVDWSRLGQLVAGIYAAPVGRPSYPPLLMVTVLLWQQWSNLSDPQLEEALGDRLSFRRFVGLGLSDDTPDHSTISRFRTALGEERSAQLFRELGQQLQARGMILKQKQGTLLDATLVAAQVRRPSLAEGRGAKSPRDADADWTYTRRSRQAHFGYEVQLGVDQRSGLVRQAVFTAAKVYESEVADQLVSGDEEAVYADWAYESSAAPALAAGAGDQRPDHAPCPQAPTGVTPLAATAQCVDRRGTQGRREGVWDAETQLWVPAGAVPGASTERGGDVLAGHGLQPAACGPDGDEWELKVG